MASLKAIRKRIASVRNTQQITKAMKMVAAAKLRRAQDAVIRSRDYADKLTEVVAGLASEGSLLDHPLVRPREPESRVMLLVLTADRGLCGGFNANLMRRSQSFLSSPGREVMLGVVGRKGVEYFKRRQIAVSEHVVGAGGIPPRDLARDVMTRTMPYFANERVDAVYLLFTRFRSAISQVPTIERLLPIEAPTGAAENPREFLCEPNRAAVIGELLPRYVEVRIFQAVLESIASEHGARMTAMESATKNASEMIDSLTLEMNRARQASITKELMEIVGGAEALKG